MNKKVTIKFFVVPNAACVFHPECGNGPVGNKFDFYHMETFVNDCKDVERFGINPNSWEDQNGNEPLDVTLRSFWIQVWCYDDENDNLTDHGIPSDHMLAFIGNDHYEKHAPRAVPYEFVKDMKEGDRKSTFIKNNGDTIEIEWVAEQLGHRYSRFGKFQDVVDAVVSWSRHYAKNVA